MNITIITPNESHLSQILALHHKYLITHLTDAEKKGGFIRVEYTENELLKIIKAKEIVAALDDSKVIGYYLVGRKSESEALNYQKNRAYTFSLDNMININRIGYGCQVCIDINYRNNGLFGKMLYQLNQLIMSKYYFLFCSISNSNLISLQSHTNNGWELIDTMETTRFYFYRTKKSKI